MEKANASEIDARARSKSDLLCRISYLVSGFIIACPFESLLRISTFQAAWLTRLLNAWVVKHIFQAGNTVVGQ